jgi:hypothetical protein
MRRKGPAADESGEILNRDQFCQHIAFISSFPFHLLLFLFLHGGLFSA